MSNWSGRFLSLCGASLLALTSTSAFAKDVSIAAISGYFAQGFGVSIVNGLKKAETDLGVNVKLIDTGNRALDYEEQFNNVAKSGEYDLVFVMGWELVDALQKASPAYPDTRFVFIDGVLEFQDDLLCQFRAEPGLLRRRRAGAAMAEQGQRSRRPGDGKAIGFVGGRDIPVIRDFLAGYEQGAKYGAPDVRVNSVFAGTFDDPAKGSELTMALYGQGADIVYNVAGPTGEGVLQASAAADKYSFGVDIDKCPVAPGHVHGEHAEARRHRGLQPGQGRRRTARACARPTYTYDLKSGGVELLYCPDVAATIPDDVKAKVEAGRPTSYRGKINSRHRQNSACSGAAPVLFQSEEGGSTIPSLHSPEPRCPSPSS